MKKESVARREPPAPIADDNVVELETVVDCPMMICPVDPTPAEIDSDVTVVSFTIYIPFVNVPPAKEIDDAEQCKIATTASDTEYAVLAY